MIDLKLTEGRFNKAILTSSFPQILWSWKTSIVLLQAS